MGYMRHHAIIVTGYNEEIVKAHAVATALFLDTGLYGPAAPVTPLSEECVNSYRSFAVLPDGSKEGWDASDLGDVARTKLVAWMRKQEFSDGSSPLSWVEVQFGDDERDTKVIHHSDEPNGSECRPYPEEEEE